MRARRAIGVLAAGMTLAFPSAALADDLYADNTGIGVACTQAAPCPLGIALVQAVSGDMVHVGGSGAASYGGGQVLAQGVSMIKESYASPLDTSGPATIGTDGNASPAVTVPAGTAPRLIDGFVLRGGAFPSEGTLYAQSGVDNLTVSGNTFDDTDDDVFVHLDLNSGSPRVTGNTFSGDDDGITRRAITYTGVGNPEIDENQIDTYQFGVELSGTAGEFATVDIHDNELTGIYHVGMTIGIGIWLRHADGALTENLIESAPAQTLVQGIDASSFVAMSDTGTPLRASRNQIYGANGGFRVSGPNPVELRDEVYGNNGVALTLAGAEDVTATATGITTQSSNPALFEISLGGAGHSLTLDSSFIGDNGTHISAAGGTCTSTFSATSEATSPNCPGIQTGVDPMFADPSPAGNDFHLLAGSPLIDAGNPAPPAPGELDIDGAARALDATPACPLVPRRDIGADEAPGAGSLDCIAPDTAVTGKRKVKTRKKRARIRFRFSATEAGSSECSLDGAAFAPCTSPFSRKVKRGAHTLEVRTADAAGNVETSPGSFTTKVKRKKRRK